MTDKTKDRRCIKLHVLMSVLISEPDDTRVQYEFPYTPPVSEFSPSMIPKDTL